VSMAAKSRGLDKARNIRPDLPLHGHTFGHRAQEHLMSDPEFEAIVGTERCPECGWTTEWHSPAERWLRAAVEMVGTAKSSTATRRSTDETPVPVVWPCHRGLTMPNLPTRRDGTTSKQLRMGTPTSTTCPRHNPPRAMPLLRHHHHEHDGMGSSTRRRRRPDLASRRRLPRLQRKSETMTPREVPDPRNHPHPPPSLTICTVA
jgi:hypothetical protein